MSKRPVRIALAGSTGYSGQEFLSLLRGQESDFTVEARIGREDKLQELKGRVDLAVLCTPNEVSLEMAPVLLEQGISVIDVSGAFRLKKHGYPEWYGFEHTAPQWLARSEYGLHPWQSIKPHDGAAPRLIANPGCYATAVAMALLPALRAKLLDPKHLFIDAKSGTSGAGKKASADLLFTELFGEFKPYKVGKHQHWPEIVETVASYGGGAIDPVFVTELLPIERGISVAVFGEWAPELPTSLRNAEALVQAFADAYAKNPDISFGSGAELASLKAVQRTNRFHVQATVAFGKPVLFAVIDNLVRGAAGQALVNARAWAGLPTQKGLS